jgi:hypothetical protein
MRDPASDRVRVKKLTGGEAAAYRYQPCIMTLHLDAVLLELSTAILERSKCWHAELQVVLLQILEMEHMQTS